NARGLTARLRELKVEITAQQQSGPVHQRHVVSSQSEVELRPARFGQLEMAAHAHLSSAHPADELLDRRASPREPHRGLNIPDRSERCKGSGGRPEYLQLTVHFAPRDDPQADTEPSLGTQHTG